MMLVRAIFMMYYECVDYDNDYGDEDHAACNDGHSNDNGHGVAHHATPAGALCMSAHMT